MSKQNVTECEGERNHALWLREILAFFGLTFALTIPFWIIGRASGNELMPGLPKAALAVICPATAALILSWRLNGVAGGRSLLMRTIDLGRVKPKAWWLLILLFSPAASVAAFFISRNDGTGIPNPQINILPAVMLFAIFLISAVSEEMGWTGFALDPLQTRVGAIPAALLIGAIWAAWHYPALLQAHRSGAWIAWWTLGTISLRLFMVWLFNRTGGSGFAVIMVHATNNLCWQLFPVQGSWFDPRINGVVMGSVALIVILTSILKKGQDRHRSRSKDYRWAPGSCALVCHRRPFGCLVTLACCPKAVMQLGQWNIWLGRLRRHRSHRAETRWMSRGLTIISTIVATLSVSAGLFWFTGLPLVRVPPPTSGMVGALNDTAKDSARREFFAETGSRSVPFQILYPALAAGRAVAYVTNAEPVVAALKHNQGLLGLALARIGKIMAPWTSGARPRTDGPFPVVIYFPGVTGYMQMSSFQTATLAADGFVVITLNQPGAVAAALLPDGRVIEGMSREEAVQLVAPSYRHSALSPELAVKLAPEKSIVPYLAADVPQVIDRLRAINADPEHPLHGLLDLEKIGVMGVSLGAIVAAQACQSYDRVKACLMVDAPAPTDVANRGLGKPALWLSRPAADQRAERAASGGWPETEITAQEDSIAHAVANSREARVVQLPGLFHIDFTDVPTIQPLVGWLGMTGPIGTPEAHRAVSSITVGFFRQMKKSSQINDSLSVGH